MCQRVYSLSSQLQFVSSGLFQEELSLSFTAASVAKKNVEGHHLLLENESERDKSSESKSYIFYTYSIISGKAKAQKKPTSAECNTKITFGNSFSLQQPLRSRGQITLNHSVK